MSDYQRACEIVGCRYGNEDEFTALSIKWLLKREGDVSFHEGPVGFQVCIYSTEPVVGSTTVKALTQAVLAVAGETTDGESKDN